MTMNTLLIKHTHNTQHLLKLRLNQQQILFHTTARKKHHRTASWLKISQENEEKSRRLLEYPSFPNLIWSSTQSSPSVFQYSTILYTDCNESIREDVEVI